MFLQKLLDEIAEKYILSQNAIPAQKKNYPSYYKDVPAFPATLCISINDILIHGIPSDRIIVKDGRHCKYRFSCIKNEFHGDCARTYLVGNVSKRSQKTSLKQQKSFLKE